MLNEIELNQLIESIDEELRKNGIPIKSRCDRALMKISKELKISLPLFPTKNPIFSGAPDVYCKAVHQWYQNRYGDRLKELSDWGCFIVLLKEDFWEFNVPEFFGECNFFISQDINDIGVGSSCNILATCNDITQDFADSLVDSDMEMIFHSFVSALDFYTALTRFNVHNLSMWEAAIADFRAARNHMLFGTPHYGQAKWSFSQFIEKLFKGLLVKAGVKNPRSFGHGLVDLAKAYNEMYSAEVSIEKIGELKTSSEVRYDQAKVTKEEIIKVQFLVFDVVKEISMSLTS
ncbi:conserved hypothetical protein [Enterobacterales bacterium 8AC]|nr:conserved hypothetical protein [Enterobacterales bacterium 8AC]